MTASTRRVVVVDDHLLVAEALRGALTDAGIDASTLEAAAFPRLLGELLEIRPALVSSIPISARLATRRS